MEEKKKNEMSNSDELLIYKDAKHGLNQPW